MESQRPSKPSPSKPVPFSPSTPGPLSSFARFVVCGGGVGLLSSAAVPLLAAAMPWALANALITVASTLLCTELHALFTFGTGRRPGRRQHLQSSGSAVAAYLATTAAMLVLHAVQPSPTVLWEQAVYLTASGLAGIGRFLVLRLFVFAERRKEAAPRSPQSPGAPEAIEAPAVPVQSRGVLSTAAGVLSTGAQRPAHSAMLPSLV
ncbi:GtrA family protein [Streptomyces cyaneus]|uniref:GtrA family protein n=1 Tax=Streptomyces cyaneus TaxID=1904 RepID=UPI001FE7A181|nr:GtrA family protein [Streptomyces cyaneus]